MRGMSRVRLLNEAFSIVVAAAIGAPSAPAAEMSSILSTPVVANPRSSRPFDGAPWIRMVTARRSGCPSACAGATVNATAGGRWQPARRGSAGTRRAIASLFPGDKASPVRRLEPARGPGWPKPLLLTGARPFVNRGAWPPPVCQGPGRCVYSGTFRGAMVVPRVSTQQQGGQKDDRQEGSGLRRCGSGRRHARGRSPVRGRGEEGLGQDREVLGRQLVQGQGRVRLRRRQPCLRRQERVQGQGLGESEEREGVHG